VKIATVFGTRPEIIRLCRVIEKLDRVCTLVAIHTGQNYEPSLSDVFFEQLGVRAPNVYLGARGTFAEQVGTILAGVERLWTDDRPDRLVVLGDTNSGLAAVVAKRLGIPVYHMEAGNRCYDDRVPEEVNRRLIDHSSDVLMPYTERSRKNLLREGIDGARIYVTGNPIFEVISHFEPQIGASQILDRLGLTASGYFLVTCHRAENVDIEPRLRSLAAAFERLNCDYGIPVIVSTHPRTAHRLRAFGISPATGGVRFLEPFGFFDFIALERNARCVLSDSGTVQEECALFGVPNVTIRDVTERPETIECGSNMLTGADSESVVQGVNAVLQLNRQWAAPPEYIVPHVSDTAVKIVLGFRTVSSQEGRAS
jgi:UDP-N-acetylglucosamine 2-epimerase (non-hydrolysing)